MPSGAPHDRAALASWLREESEYRPLKQLSLGRAMALVNLLLSSHSVLGKRNGRLVPYPFSDDYEKQENARRCVPTGLRVDEAYVQSWPELMDHLYIVLDVNGGELMTARLKNEFRNRFQLELCESALGHMSLGSLLDDPRLMAEFDVIKQPPAADVLRARFDPKSNNDGKNAPRATASPQRHRQGHTGGVFDEKTGCGKHPKHGEAMGGKQQVNDVRKKGVAVSQTIALSKDWMHRVLIEAMEDSEQRRFPHAGLSPSGTGGNLALLPSGIAIEEV
eukprot:TRINITY_DN62272_c0_g1_i1.p1 TRINITY_DN62272_c0_g1~~TRINITY_DN62272_c0_g1_i1.p1  ORF type:complete len:277 (-),score=50.17 TRINITY_DN62272_c0_g1_i1:148-978(-)